MSRFDTSSVIWRWVAGEVGFLISAVCCFEVGKVGGSVVFGLEVLFLDFSDCFLLIVWRAEWVMLFKNVEVV
jgi:hypothetical protein